MESRAPMACIALRRKIGLEIIAWTRCAAYSMMDHLFVMTDSLVRREALHVGVQETREQEQQL